MSCILSTVSADMGSMALLPLSSGRAQDHGENGVKPESLKLVTCHLGNGCRHSYVGGKVTDTSMGMTPAEGLMMGTRAGDMDPAIMVYVQRRLG